MPNFEFFKNPKTSLFYKRYFMEVSCTKSENSDADIQKYDDGLTDRGMHDADTIGLMTPSRNQKYRHHTFLLLFA